MRDESFYQEDKARKAETEDKLAIEAMKSKYTTLLLENMLLSPFEMQDTKTWQDCKSMFTPSMTN